MGRNRVQIRKLQSIHDRQTTYSKRKMGITKKAKEIAILCDIDLLLLMFSPRAKPLLTLSPKSDLSSIFNTLAELGSGERARRKAETLEALKKGYKNTDHNVEMRRLTSEGKPTEEDLCDQLKDLTLQVQEKSEKLRLWENLELIDDIGKINSLEETLMASINRLQKHKVLLQDIEAYAKWTTASSSSQKKRVPWMKDSRAAAGAGGSNLPAKNQSVINVAGTGNGMELPPQQHPFGGVENVFASNPFARLGHHHHQRWASAPYTGYGGYGMNN